MQNGQYHYTIIKTPQLQTLNGLTFSLELPHDQNNINIALVAGKRVYVAGSTTYTTLGNFSQTLSPVKQITVDRSVSVPKTITTYTSLSDFTNTALQHADITVPITNRSFKDIYNDVIHSLDSKPGDSIWYTGNWTIPPTATGRPITGTFRIDPNKRDDQHYIALILPTLKDLSYWSFTLKTSPAPNKMLILAARINLYLQGEQKDIIGIQGNTLYYLDGTTRSISDPDNIPLRCEYGRDYLKVLFIGYIQSDITAPQDFTITLEDVQQHTETITSTSVSPTKPSDFATTEWHKVVGHAYDYTTAMESAYNTILNEAPEDSYGYITSGESYLLGEVNSFWISYAGSSGNPSTFYIRYIKSPTKISFSNLNFDAKCIGYRVILLAKNRSGDTTLHYEGTISPINQTMAKTVNCSIDSNTYILLYGIAYPDHNDHIMLTNFPTHTISTGQKITSIVDSAKNLANQVYRYANNTVGYTYGTSNTWITTPTLNGQPIKGSFTIGGGHKGEDSYIYIKIPSGKTLHNWSFTLKTTPVAGKKLLLIGGNASTFSLCVFGETKPIGGIDGHTLYYMDGSKGAIGDPDNIKLTCTNPTFYLGVGYFGSDVTTDTTFNITLEDITNVVQDHNETIYTLFANNYLKPVTRLYSDHGIIKVGHTDGSDSTLGTIPITNPRFIIRGDTDWLAFGNINSTISTVTPSNTTLGTFATHINNPVNLE